MPVCMLVNSTQSRAGWGHGPLPHRPTWVLAQAANLALATAPLAAAAGKAGQHIPAAASHPGRSLPAGSTTIEGLGGFGQGQPLAGAHSVIQFAGRVVCIGFSFREEVSCKSKEEESGLSPCRCHFRLLSGPVTPLSSGGPRRRSKLDFIQLCVQMLALLSVSMPKA